jgi:hypothetical protein
MAIYARYSGKTFTPCPEGLHVAVCVDVVDLGEVDTSFGRKFRVRLTWQIEQADPATGKRHAVVKSYTNSLHKRATLRADLESWRGRKFTEDEVKRFDLETLLGVNAMLHVVQETSEDGTVYSNIRALMPVPKGTPKLASLDYTRHQDRSRQTAGARPAAVPPAAPTEPDGADDDIDFAFGSNVGEVQ